MMKKIKEIKERKVGLIVKGGRNDDLIIWFFKE